MVMMRERLRGGLCVGGRQAGRQTTKSCVFNKGIHLHGGE